jgi:hypothetical protein
MSAAICHDLPATTFLACFRRMYLLFVAYSISLQNNLKQPQRSFSVVRSRAVRIPVGDISHRISRAAINHEAKVKYSASLPTYTAKVSKGRVPGVVKRGGWMAA